MKTKVDAAGRLVIPLPLRRLLGLSHGGEVDLEPTGDGLVIRRRQGSVDLTEDDEGYPVIVLADVETVTNAEVLEALNADRAAR